MTYLYVYMYCNHHWAELNETPKLLLYSVKWCTVNVQIGFA